MKDLWREPLEILIEQFTRVEIWWRDDDAFHWTAEIDRLFELREKHSVPLFLSVIPGKLEDSLRSAFHSTEQVWVLQHGWEHEDNSEIGDKACEFACEILAEGQRRQICAGRDILVDSFGQNFVPIFVPPWNRLPKALESSIIDLGYRGISKYSRKSSARSLDSHIDIVNWRSKREFIGSKNVKERIDEVSTPSRGQDSFRLGLLTHHKDHSRECWDFVDNFLEAVSQYDQVELIGPEALLEQA